MSGGSNQSRQPDLFSAENPSPSESKQTPKPTYALPINLSSALKHLDDEQLDRLLGALLSEQERRGKKPFSSNVLSAKGSIETAVIHLTISKVNAIRAAFKAGVKPSQIARQFGLSQTDVRKALASHEKK